MKHIPFRGPSDIRRHCEARLCTAAVSISPGPQTTQRNIAEGLNRQQHCYGNLKYRMYDTAYCNILGRAQGEGGGAQLPDCSPSKSKLKQKTHKLFFLHDGVKRHYVI